MEPSSRVAARRPAVRQGPARAEHLDGRRDRRRARPGLLLRAAGSRTGLPAEDLLRARAAGDRRAVRLRARRAARDPAPAHTRPALGHALLRRHPHEPDLRRRHADHRLDLGQGLVGALVGVERAHARLVPDHLPAVRHLPAAALRDRGPRAPGALRLRVRDHRRGVRAAQLRRRQPVHRLPAPARVQQHLEPARLDGAHAARLAARDRAAVRHAVQVRADRQAHARAAARAAQAPGRREHGRAPAAQRRSRRAARLRERCDRAVADRPIMPARTAGRAAL